VVKLEVMAEFAKRFAAIAMVALLAQSGSQSFAQQVQPQPPPPAQNDQSPQRTVSPIRVSTELVLANVVVATKAATSFAV
jgi:hypothetical protein